MLHIWQGSEYASVCCSIVFIIRFENDLVVWEKLMSKS